MALGPIEVVMVVFPESRFTGTIAPELDRLVQAGTISIVDGIIATKTMDGEIAYMEFAEVANDPDAAALAELVQIGSELIGHDDVEELAAALEPGATAAILAFEHTWFKPLRDAVRDSGGQLAANFRIPGYVVEEVLAAVATAIEEE
jgi:Family of unknown function (DUF6325)